MPLLYYMTLAGIVLVKGVSWGELMVQLGDAGWITMPDAGKGSQPFWEVYELYDLVPWRADRIAWGVLLRQVPMTLALFSVVLFGSCLDITAIQASLPYEVRRPPAGKPAAAPGRGGVVLDSGRERAVGNAGRCFARCQITWHWCL